jgi:hypothetical protein
VTPSYWEVQLPLTAASELPEGRVYATLDAVAIRMPAAMLPRRPFRLDPLKPPFDAVDPSEKLRRALLCRGVDLPDLAGCSGQVGVIQPRGNFVFLGLCKKPAQPQRLLEETESRVERALPLRNCERDLSSEPRTDMVMAAHAEGVKAQRLIALADDRNNDGWAFNPVGLPAKELPVGMEHYMQMRPGIDLVPSTALLGHVLLDPPLLVLFRHYHPPSRKVVSRHRTRLH